MEHQHYFTNWYISYSNPLYNTVCLTDNRPVGNMGHYERTCKICGLVQTIYDMTPKEFLENKKGQTRVLKK